MGDDMHVASRSIFISLTAFVSDVHATCIVCRSYSLHAIELGDKQTTRNIQHVLNNICIYTIYLIWRFHFSAWATTCSFGVFAFSFSLSH